MLSDVVWWQAGPDIGHLAVEPVGVFRRFDETPTAVEVGGVDIYGIDHDESRSRGIAGSHGFTEGFGQESAPEALALVGDVDGEPGDEDGANRVASARTISVTSG